MYQMSLVAFKLKGVKLAVLIIQVKALYVRGSGGVASFSKHEE